MRYFVMNKHFEWIEVTKEVHATASSDPELVNNTARYDEQEQLVDLLVLNIFTNDLQKLLRLMGVKISSPG